jgi:hypothetical protein
LKPLRRCIGVDTVHRCVTTATDSTDVSCGTAGTTVCRLPPLALLPPLLQAYGALCGRLRARILLRKPLARSAAKRRKEKKRKEKKRKEKKRKEKKRKEKNVREVFIVHAKEDNKRGITTNQQPNTMSHEKQNNNT